MASTPQALGDQIVKFFGHKTGKELMMEKAGNVADAGGGATQSVAGKTSARVAPAMPVKPGYVPPPSVAHVAVPQIRQEIQKIFDLNKKIKNVQNGSSLQLQRVQEQARIHQKILDQLEASQKQENGIRPSAKNALLAQEKLRIIHEETLRNTKVVEDLKTASASLAPKVTPKEIPKAKVSAS